MAEREGKRDKEEGKDKTKQKKLFYCFSLVIENISV